VSVLGVTTEGGAHLRYSDFMTIEGLGFTTMSGEYLDYSMKIIILMAMSVLLSLYGRYWYVMHESNSRIEKNTVTKIPAETKQSIYTKIIHTNQLIETLANQQRSNEFPIHMNQSVLSQIVIIP
jgi:hypothetical protein